MNEIVEIICDTAEEARFAQAILQQRGHQNIQVKQTKQVTVLEVEGTKPRYVFSGKYSRMAQQLWIVSGEK
jgi:hypothetical protein